jgi:hypothetical protein
MHIQLCQLLTQPTEGGLIDALQFEGLPTHKLHSKGRQTHTESRLNQVYNDHQTRHVHPIATNTALESKTEQSSYTAPRETVRMCEPSHLERLQTADAHQSCRCGAHTVLGLGTTQLHGQVRQLPQSLWRVLSHGKHGGVGGGVRCASGGVIQQRT